MRQRSLCVLGAVAVAGLALMVTTPSAFARTPTSPSIHSTIGHSATRVLGNGKTFSLASCVSSSPSSVPCEISQSPVQHFIRVWCLTGTAPAGVGVTVSYLANTPRTAIPPTTVTVHCKVPPVGGISTPGSKTTTALSASAPKFTVVGCSTDVVGTACTYAGETITKVCTLAAYSNTLPVTVTATVKLAGSAVITGRTIQVPFECKPSVG